jgi:hypothetical protein
MEIPFQEIAGWFGITLSPGALSVLKVLQWIIYFLIISGGVIYGWFQREQKRQLQKEKKDRELEGHDLDWIVIGAGAVTTNGQYHIRTLAEKQLVPEFGETFADLLHSVAETTIKTPGTQILSIKSQKLRGRVRARATNKINEYLNPEIIGFLAQRTGYSRFVCCFSCSDYAESRKVRLSIRSLGELGQYKPSSALNQAIAEGSIENLVLFRESYHRFDASVTAEMSESWNINPTSTNVQCWEVELFGRFEKA